MKKTLALVLFLTILFSSVSWGEEKVSKKEMDTFLEAIKEKKDEELLIASDQFKECEEKFKTFREDTSKKDEFKKCVKDKIVGDSETEGSDEQVLEIAKNLDLQSFNKEASSTTSSIRNYLEKRLHKAIYGTEDNDKVRQKLKDQNIVDHSVFYQLYAEQIGKNTLLQVSTYCLENFGYDKPENFLFIDKDGTIGVDQTTNKEEDGKGLFTLNVLIRNQTLDPSIINPEELKKIKYVDRKEIRTDLETKQPTSIGSMKSFWKNTSIIKEYKICNLGSEEKCDKEFGLVDYRPLYYTEVLKEAEFLLSKDDPKKTRIKDRYGFCAGQVIKNMCEIYKCNNVYDTGTTDLERKRCLDQFSIDIDDQTHKTISKSDDPNKKQVADISLESRNTKGHIACNLKQRLEEYRVILKQVKEIKDHRSENHKNLAVFGSDGFKGVYDGTKKGSRADDLTSISSTDLAKNVDTFKNAEKDTAALRKDCYDGDEKSGYTLKPDALEDTKCEKLAARLNKAQFDTIQMDTEAKTALRMKEIEQIKGKEDLKEFLTKNGLTKYIGRLDQISDNPEELEKIKNLVSQNFQSKRMALIDGLKERFRKEKDITVGEEDSEALNKGKESAVANQNLADIEQHKKRVETLFEYSNIVSSYLTVTEGEGKDQKEVGQNITGRSLEIKDNEGNLEAYFRNSEESGSGSKDGINYLGALDSIINFEEETKEQEKREKKKE